MSYRQASTTVSLGATGRPSSLSDSTSLGTGKRIVATEGISILDKYLQRKNSSNDDVCGMCVCVCAALCLLACQCVSVCVSVVGNVERKCV